MLNQELKIRLQDPRIILNEFFGYGSFITGLITAVLLISGQEELYKISNQIMLASCALQNIPLLMVYIPQWRVLISSGICGIIVTNYFATNPIGNAFREGLFVSLIKIDYSYEALNKYHPEQYPPEKDLLGSHKLKYAKTIVRETFRRSYEMLLEIKAGNFKAFIHDAIRSQFFSSLMRIISATPLFIIAILELSAWLGFWEKTPVYIQSAELWTTVSVRALAFSSFIDGLSKIAFGFMRESLMMRIGGSIFAAAQFYLMLSGENALKLVIPLSLAGLAAYPIVEAERLSKLAKAAALADTNKR